ncbi:MAG: hypothetical protein ACRYG8_41345, partial [Janthinobacterium lividum]
RAVTGSPHRGIASLPKGHSPLITPILRKPHTDTEGTENSAEARMRQALGKLGTARPGKSDAPRRTNPYQAKPGAGRHRFRQDGEVPVVRISLAEGNRSGEHQPRAPAEAAQAGAGQGHGAGVRGQDSGGSARQVQVLTEQLQATRTRLGHAELVASEASRTVQARQEEAGGLRRALDTAEAALAQVRAELAASERAREELVRHRDALRPIGGEADERDDTAVRRRVGRPLGSTRCVRNQAPASEPAPVKWWAGD